MKKAENTTATLTEETSQILPMNVEVRVGSIRLEGSVRAIATINLNSCFAIRNIKVLEGSKGLFVAMPRYKVGCGEYRDICFPITKEFYDQLNSAVMTAYHQAISRKLTPTQTNSFSEGPEPESGMQMDSM